MKKFIYKLRNTSAKTFVKKLVLSVGLIAVAITAQAQMNYWTTPPFKFNMNTNPPTSSALYTGAPNSGSYGVANGAYDGGGHLLFYVQDNMIYDSNGSTIGLLGHDIPHQQSSPHTMFGGEVAIVPVPGECSQYYVIYSGCDLWASVLFYVMVDCSGSVPVIHYANNPYTNAPMTSNSSPIQNMDWFQDDDFNWWDNQGYPAHIIGGGLYGNIGIAVSKKVGIGVNAIYYLYYSIETAIGGELNYKIISSSGIGSGGSIQGFSTLGNYTPELELSDDGNYLAWSDNDNVQVITLANNTSYVTNSYKSYSFGGNKINGLEFGNSNGTVPYLYVAVGTDFYEIDITPLNTVTQISTNYNIGNSFLELGKSGVIYAVGSDISGNLYMVGYNPSNQNISANQIYFDSNHGNLTNAPLLQDVYTLPDQIDGEDYDNFNTLPLPQAYPLTINGISPSIECGDWSTKVYNCDGIYLPEQLFDGLPCESNITITSYDEACNPVWGSNYFNYSGDLVLNDDGFVVEDFRDLRNLTSIVEIGDDVRELSLANTPGYYGITVTLGDCCGKKPQVYTVYVHVLGGLPTNISMQIRNPLPATNYSSISQLISSPVIVGAKSLGFIVNNTGGNITSMDVLVEEIDNTDETTLQTIINETKAITGTSVPYELLNDYCVSTSVWGYTPPTNQCQIGYDNYFFHNAANTTGISVMGHYYKLTVTLHNPCSSVSQWSYMKINNSPYSKETIATSIEENQFEKTEVKFYPNPTAGEINISVSNNVSNTYNIELFDISGRKVTTLQNNLNLEKGNHVLPADISNVANGMYLWKVSSNSFNKSGIISISK